jgi:nicotinamidase-related amidase
MEFEGSQVSEPPAVRSFVHLKGKSMKAALLIIDVQKESIKTESITSQSIRKAIACINAAIILFRKNSLPIIGIQYINEEEHLVPGMDGFEITETVNILPSDIRIQKTHGNAFINTDLQRILKENNINTLILTGYSAEYCVLSTYRGARDLDLHPIILRNSIASENSENIKFVENICEIVSLVALQNLL